ncbi:TPA: glycosyltransferase family 25 protein [Providencia alcalifaciens]
MKHTIPIYIISLKKDEIRREILTKKLLALDLRWIVIDAVDGSKLQPDYINSLNYQYGNAAHVNEVACSLSHQAAYKSILDSGVEWAIILEDDVSIDEKLADLVNGFNDDNLLKLKSDNIYLLGGQEGLNSRKRLSLSFFNKINIGGVIFRKLTYKPSKIFRTCCYMIHRDECKKLIDLFNCSYYCADSWGLFYKLNIVDGYYLTEIIKHPIVTVENSNIERYRLEVDKSTARRKKGKIESFLSFTLLSVRKFFRSLKY